LYWLIYKFGSNKIEEAFKKLWIDKETTNFFLFWEYLWRCVDNVAVTLKKRNLTNGEPLIMAEYCLLKEWDAFNWEEVIYWS
jgi:hypothetical protein